MKRLSSFSIFLFGVATVLTPAFVFAQDDSYGLKATANAAGLEKYGNDVPALIGNVIGTALSLISVIFFVLMIYGGLRWMLSRGNEDQSKKALDTIIAAIIGIIIVLASYAITTFVFNSIGTASAGGGGDTPKLTWCLTPENNCVQGSGGGCANPQASESACIAAKEQAGTPKKADGATCTAGTQCTSEVCTGGVCGGAVDASICTNGGTVCPTGQTCNTVTKECLLDSQIDCTQPGLSCPSGKTCDLATKTCV